MSFRRLGISVSLAWFNGTAFPLQIHHCPLYRVEKFQDLLNPVPYSHATESRISNPASSIATASLCHVRVPPKASRCPPGFRTRKHSSAQSLPGGNASHLAPINPNPYGGSVTIASTLFSGRLRITSIQSP